MDIRLARGIYYTFCIYTFCNYIFCNNIHLYKRALKKNENHRTLKKRLLGA